MSHNRGPRGRQALRLGVALQFKCSATGAKSFDHFFRLFGLYVVIIASLS
jgi:hypothetical protein